MKVVFLRSCGEAEGQRWSPAAELDAVVSAELASVGVLQEVEVTALPPHGRWPRKTRGASRRARRLRAGDPFGEISEAVLTCDWLVTSGWPALAACERIGVIADVHVMDDFGASLDGPASAVDAGELDAVEEARRFDLTNRARRLLVLQGGDARRLRSRGRFPYLLLTDRTPSDLMPGAASAVRVNDLAAWLVAREPVGHAELTIADAMSRVAQRSIPHVRGLLDACLGYPGPGPGRIQTVNLQHIHLAMMSPVFRELIADAPAITADGWPVVRLFRRNGYLAVERATGADLVAELLDDERARGLRLALVGGAEAPGTAFESRATAAGATVVFREHGDKRDWDPAVLAAQLNDSGASLALLAVTQPAGDLLAAELVAAGYRGTAIGIGAAVELFVGGERRAARWVQDLGLEWMFRFLQNPARLWRRYFLEGLPTYFTVVRPLIRTRSLARVVGLEPLTAP